MKVNESNLKLYCRNPNITEFLTGTDRLQKIYVFDINGNFLSATDNNGISSVDLSEGANQLGLYITGMKNNKTGYCDFRWFTVNYVEPVIGDDEILKSKKCIVRIHFDGHYRQVDQDNVTTEFDRQDYWGNFSSNGSFTGNTFTGSWNESLGSSNYSGTVIVTLNQDYNSVLDVDWTEVYTSYTNSQQAEVDGSATSSFSASNIPKSVLYPGVFGVDSAQTCNNINLIEYVSNSLSTSIKTTLESHSCDQYSYFQIIFSE